MKGITRFGQWYGNPYGDWDAMFVSFCLNYAGVPQTAVPYGDDCAGWVDALSDFGLYQSDVAYSPAKGDIVFFDYNGDGASDHAGLVANVSDDASSFNLIEGDAGNRVQQTLHSVADSDDALQPEKQDDNTAGIALDETKTIAVGAGETVKLQFVPDYSHEYIFYSSTSGDTYGYIYDTNGKPLTHDDDGGSNSNFKITYTLNGGETYYWGTRWYSSTKTGDITVHLELGTKHVYTKNEQGELVCVCGNIAPESGICGDSLSWSFDKETGTLSVTGSGAMTKYTVSNKAPWAHLSSLIKTVESEYRTV